MSTATLVRPQRHRLIPDLPRAAWIVLLGDGVSALGQGMSLPFLLVYLNEVRGIDLSTAGLVLATVALASFIGNPLGGWLSDPFGARATLLISLALSATGVGALAYVDNAPFAFLAAALVGLGNAIAWPAFDALLATIVVPERRSGAFSVRHATLNGGLAIGAFLAGLVVDTAHPGTFQVVYLVDALTFVLFMPMLLLIPSPPRRQSTETVEQPNYRAVLADKTFLSVVGLSALIVIIGFAQYHAAMPGWATREGGIPVSALGWCFAANAATVVLLQLPMLHLLLGRLRTSAISLACAGWAISWTMALLFGFTGAGWWAQAGFVLTMIVFGIAETALSPTLPAIVNDLAPENLRGRYNGVSALGWTTGYFLGPAITGFALEAEAGAPLLIGLIGACIVAGFWAARLGQRLPRSANVITA